MTRITTMKKIIRNVSSSATNWSQVDRFKNNLQVPKIIVTTASLDHLDSPDKMPTVYLRPLGADGTKVTPKPTSENEISSVGEITEPANQSSENVKNLQYEWIGEPLEQRPAPDGGWGWLVLVGVVFMACTLTSLGPCFGVLFNDIMVAMGVSSTRVAWVFNVNMFAWNIASIVSGPLIKHFGWRAVGCTSSFLLSVAFILIAFSWSPLYIFFMFGVLTGALSGIAFMTCVLILPAYFNKRRGMANSLFSAGIPIGYIIFPVLIRYLQDEFGFFGATIIHGALLFNCCVACALFRPLKASKKPLPKSTKKISIESGRLEPLLAISSESDSTANSQKPGSLSSWVMFLEVLRAIHNNLKGMSHKPLLLTTTSIALFLICSLNYVSMLPFALRHHGYSAKEASYAVSMTGVGNMIIRLVVSCIADAKWVNRKYVYILGLIITGSCCFLTPIAMSNYSYLTVIFVLWGVGMALSSSTYMVMLIDVVGLSLFESSMSILAFLLAFISVAAGPVFGYIRDVTSSYSWSLTAVAALQFVSVLMWAFMPCAQRMHDRRVFLKFYRETYQRPGRFGSARRGTYPARRSSEFPRQGHVPMRRDTYPGRLSSRPPMMDPMTFWRNSSIPRGDIRSTGRNISPLKDIMHISVPARVQPISERVLINVQGKLSSLSSPSSSR